MNNQDGRHQSAAHLGVRGAEITRNEMDQAGRTAMSIPLPAQSDSPDQTRRRVAPDSFLRDRAVCVRREQQLQDMLADMRQIAAIAARRHQPRLCAACVARVWIVKTALWLHGFHVPTPPRLAGQSAGARLAARLHRRWIDCLSRRLPPLSHVADRLRTGLPSDITSFQDDADDIPVTRLPVKKNGANA